MSKATEEITEGSATVLFKKGEVFYNEVQIKNRDLSVLVLNTYAEQVKQEALGQVERRKKGLSWRKLKPTWSDWGRPSIDENAAAAKKGTAPRGGFEDLEEKDVKLQGLYVLEALSASGLRSIRYAKEVTEGVGLERIMVNDLEEHAVDAIKKNIEHNKLPEGVAVPNQADASEVMFNHRVNKSMCQHTRVKQFLHEGEQELDYDVVPFDVVDIDPYGSPAVFLDTAVQACRDGGLLCITATDLRTICGSNTDVAFPKYGSMPLKAKYGHEMAIRIVLASIERSANRYSRYIVPQLCVQMDFYLRVFVRIYTEKLEIKSAATKLSMILQSSECDSFFLQPLGTKTPKGYRSTRFQTPTQCPQTGAAMKFGGPIWSHPIYNPAFVKAAMSQLKKSKSNYGAAKMVEGILHAVSEEVLDAPLYYSLPSLCKTLRCSQPPMLRVHSGLINAGYKVSQVHCDPDGLKTNAGPEIVWDILKQWTTQSTTENPSKKAKTDNTKETVKDKIMKLEQVIEADFTIPKDLAIRLKKRKDTDVSRWLPNPKANWGPKARARGTNKLQTHPKRKHE